MKRVVEVGIKLEKDLNYYDKILKEHGAVNCFCCETHDVYYTNKDLNGLTENEMKNACIRFRNPNNETKKEEKRLLNSGYIKVFDTTKIDYHYTVENSKSKIQLQQIKDIGLLVYYDNPAYYDLPIKEQRGKLIEELNSYGFHIKIDTLGLDKLRTLYYKKECFSENQNG